MTIRPDIADWLGDFAANVDQDQANRLADLFDTITARWPDEDMADVRRETQTGAAQVVLGDDSLDGIAAAWVRAAQAERDAMAQLRGAVLASSTGARSGPGSESDLINRTGVTRTTIRRILGR